MSKRSDRRLSKKGLDGLLRAGTFPKRVWVWKGKTFGTLREVCSFRDRINP